MLGVALWLLDAFLNLFGPLLRITARLVEPLGGAVNPLVKGLSPVVKPALRAMVKMEPVFKPLTNIMIRSVIGADPALYDISRK